jgi:hypothetical protein
MYVLRYFQLPIFYSFQIHIIEVDRRKSVHSGSIIYDDRSLYSRVPKNWAIICFWWNSTSLSAKLQSHTWISTLWKGSVSSTFASRGTLLLRKWFIAHQNTHLPHENISRVPFTCDFCQLKYSTLVGTRAPFGHKNSCSGASEYNWKQATSFSCGGGGGAFRSHTALSIFSIYLFRYK